MNGTLKRLSPSLAILLGPISYGGCAVASMASQWVIHVLRAPSPLPLRYNNPAKMQRTKVFTESARRNTHTGDQRSGPVFRSLDEMPCLFFRSTARFSAIEFR